MGLPMWRAPSPEAKDAIKVDLTAPARSPIRRRSPFAGRRVRPSRSPRSPRLLDSVDPLMNSTSQVLSHPEPAPRPSNVRPHLPPPPVPESRNYSRSGDSAQDMPDVLPNDQALDRYHGERYYRSLYERSSRLQRFGEVSPSSRQLPAFTPNFAPAAASRNFRPGNGLESRERSSFRSRSPYSRVGARSRSPWAETASTTRDNPTTIEDADGDSSDNNAVGFPPLRRMGRRTIADGPLPSSSLRESWSPATTLDGLGDRDRSISPVDDHWDTMLSTVAPDPLAPTVDSSFTSAAASASFSNSGPSSRAGSSNSNSAASSRTHLTVPSRRHSHTEIFIRACDTSEDDTASDTEEEDMELIPGESSTGQQIYRTRHRFLADDPPMRNPSRYSRAVRDRSRDASAYVHNFYSQRTPRESIHQPERPLSGGLDALAEATQNFNDDMQTLDQELRDARAMLERLARREGGIPDEFWASVGLARPAADRIERLQQRERL
ncbi:uncharacterized protein BDR25DRAFT_72239 [Lindgomyces ingoldianus]|uniref:Uncharacterized protein n=1 Tax=Lindgomyces ingoldianus TaxID=673940 RepID=A0ACB6QLJ8_9PLEO|nr:uncharacterized protein BDR25DRAFT_72239 [Lindgomyces ingoldianus]KAF2467002.1 hypothetical protein BDR25DRAFT_72239 [Lindgomyces ingoldianus]